MKKIHFHPVSAENQCTHLDYRQVLFSVDGFMGLLCKKQLGTGVKVEG